MKVLLILAAVLHLGCLEEAREPFRMPDLCTEMGPDQGTCGDYNVRWFFNPEDGQCKQFMYSGCGGNQNNFKTLEECEKMCKGIPEKDDQQELTSGDDQPPTETASTEFTPKEASEKKDQQDKGVNTETEENKETNLDNNNEGEGEENDEEGLDDGEEDEQLISKFLNVGDGMSVEDSQALKEAMAAFDVSVLQEVPSEEQINMEDEQQEQREQQLEQQQEQQPEQQQQQQQKLEAQAEMNENINEHHQESLAEHADQMNEDMAAGGVSEPRIGNTEDQGYVEETSQRLQSFLDGLHTAITPEDREAIQEGISEYGNTVMEAQQDMAEEMESVQYQEQQANEEKDISGEVKGAQQELDAANAELEEAHADISNVNNPPETAMEGSDEDGTDGGDDDDDNDDEAEGIDVEEEYPPIRGMLSPEDRATLAEAISAFDVVEAVSNGRDIEGEVVARIPLREGVNEKTLDQQNVSKEETVAGRSEQTTTNNPNHSTTEATEEQSTKDAIHEDKAAILNTEEMNDKDRQMLNELVSNYDVNVVQEESDSDKTEESEKSEKTNGSADTEAESTEPNGLLSPRCTLPPVSGPCRARMIRWYFDMDTGKCTSFVYGGCRGNGNRFISRRKCMASCLAARNQRPSFLPTNGIPVTPTHNPAIHAMPTQSPTKKITFMMPLLSLFSKRNAPSSMSSFRQLPQPTQSQAPQMADRANQGRRMAPSSAFPGRDVMPTMRHGSMAMKTRPEPATEEAESNSDQFRPPFSPFRYLITRAMFKTTINHRDARPAPSDEQKAQPNPLPSRIRIMLPRGPAAKMPSFQKQQPVPKLGPMRPLMQLIEQLRLPLFDRGRARAFGQRDDSSNENMDRPPTPAIFAPKMVKKSEFESLNHDNRHLNMVSPNNKFTLLQVFVNKHGGHQNMADPAVRMRQPAGQINKVAPSRMSPEPFSQTVRSFQPSDYRPVLSMRPAYNPYQTGVWNVPQPALPPHLYAHYHQHGYPFQYPIHRPIGGIPLPQPRPQPMPRRPPMMRPLVITAGEEETQEEESEKSHYACLLPLAPGPCKSYQTKWYYNRDSGKCEIFYYTGCAGNANNFETWEECAATCLETPSEPKSTIPSEASDSSRATDNEKAEEDERPDTIIITSTMYPDNEAEARQAIEEAKTEAPSADSKENVAEEEHEEPKEERVEPEEKKQMDEVHQEQHEKEELVDKHVVISEVGAMSTHYILLLAVITIVALAVIVLVTISIVHLCRKMRAGKKERVLEAVIKQQLSAEAPQLVYTTKPAPEQTEKPQV